MTIITTVTSKNFSPSQARLCPHETLSLSPGPWNLPSTSCLRELDYAGGLMYEWGHTPSVLFCLTCLTQHNVLGAHPRSSRGQSLLSVQAEWCRRSGGPQSGGPTLFGHSPIDGHGVTPPLLMVKTAAVDLGCVSTFESQEFLTNFKILFFYFIF